MSPLTRASLERWMFNKDGMDYGPFSAHDIEMMIESGELTPDSEIVNYKSRISAPIRLVPYFIDFIEEKAKRDAEKAHQAEVERDTRTVKAKAERSHKVPIAIGVTLAVAAGIASWMLLRDPVIPKSGYPITFFRDLSIPVLKPMKATLSSPVEIEREETRQKAMATGGIRRRAGVGAGGSGGVNTASGTGVIEAPELDYSFGGDGAEPARDLTREDLEQLKHAVTPGLIGCFQKEAANVDGFRGGKVVFYVMPKGKVAVSKLETSPAPSAALTSCVTSTVNSRKIAPYSGDIQVIELPLRVSAGD